MYTTNDVLFSAIQSCEDGLESNKLIYYIYIYQIAGLDYKFRYKIDASGLSCVGINNLLSQTISSGYIQLHQGVATLTAKGDAYLYNIPMTAKEWDFIEFIKTILDALTEDELKTLCITDMIVFDTLDKYGVDGLIRQESRIKASIRALCGGALSDEDFNASLKILRKVRERNE